MHLLNNFEHVVQSKALCPVRVRSVFNDGLKDIVISIVSSGQNFITFVRVYRDPDLVQCISLVVLQKHNREGICLTVKMRRKIEYCRMLYLQIWSYMYHFIKIRILYTPHHRNLWQRTCSHKQVNFFGTKCINWHCKERLTKRFKVIY